MERQKAAIDLTARLGARHCRTLSGQRFPGLTRQEGIERTVDGIRRSLEHAERRGVVLCMENHYKDGTWRYPEFAQPEDIFLEILEQIDSPYFGVQYDPSNAFVGGYDPIRFLEKVRHRVVTMHASDRYLAPGATLDDLQDGRRRDRLRRRAEARGNGQGPQRLRRDLPAAGGGGLRRLDLARGRHERSRRDAPIGRVPHEEARGTLGASGLGIRD